MYTCDSSTYPRTDGSALEHHLGVISQRCYECSLTAHFLGVFLFSTQIGTCLYGYQGHHLSGERMSWNQIILEDCPSLEHLHDVVKRDNLYPVVTLDLIPSL